MIKLPQTERDQLRAHLSGAQPVIAANLALLERMRQRGLITTRPARALRPRTSQLTPQGQRLAEQLQPLQNGQP